MDVNPIRGSTQAAAAMLLVGSLIAVSATVADYPTYGGQALRYAVGGAILYLVLLWRRPAQATAPLTRRDLAQLAALASTGLAAFNVCIVEAVHHVSPALIALIVGSGPVVLAVLGPLVARTGPPSPRVVSAALLVAGGAGLAAGFGGGDLTGVALALGALAGEVAFTLLAVPLLPRIGALRVSTYSALISAPLLLTVGFLVDGGEALRIPSAAEAAGLTYLAVAVTAAAFLLWYDAVSRLGPDRAGLFAGVIPVSAMATIALLLQQSPSVAELAGAVCVTAGIGLGVRRRTSAKAYDVRKRRLVPKSEV